MQMWNSTGYPLPCNYLYTISPPSPHKNTTYIKSPSSSADIWDFSSQPSKTWQVFDCLISRSSCFKASSKSPPVKKELAWHNGSGFGHIAARRHPVNLSEHCRTQSPVWMCIRMHFPLFTGRCCDIYERALVTEAEDGLEEGWQCIIEHHVTSIAGFLRISLHNSEGIADLHVVCCLSFWPSTNLATFPSTPSPPQVSDPSPLHSSNTQ